MCAAFEDNDMWKKLLGAAILAQLGFGAVAASATADSYPSRPIRLLDGFAAGGSSDFLARSLGAKLTERLGQTVIVDNRPGASSNIAAEITVRANPDGYTLMLAAMTALASSRSLYAKLPFDLFKDLSFVTMVASGAQVLLAHPAVPAKSVTELVALARATPNAISYGTGGVGTPGHLAMELLQIRTGMQLVHVPYKGTAPSLVALSGGEVGILFASLVGVVPMIQAKRFNALAVTTPKRLGVLPQVPTVAESGYPGFNVTSTFGLLAPAGTPAAIVKLLTAEIRTILQTDDIRAKLATQALEATPSTPDEFKITIEAEAAQWASVVRQARITI